MGVAEVLMFGGKRGWKGCKGSGVSSREVELKGFNEWLKLVRSNSLGVQELVK